MTIRCSKVLGMLSEDGDDVFTIDSEDRKAADRLRAMYLAEEATRGRAPDVGLQPAASGLSTGRPGITSARSIVVRAGPGGGRRSK